MNGKQRQSRSFETILHGAASPSRIKSQRRPPTLPSLAYGAEEAERLGHRHIDVDHLFMGVVREEDGTAGQILRSAGLNVINMREQMLLDVTATE